MWDKLKGFKTEISRFALIQATAYAIEFNNQRSGIHAGDWDSYKDFASVLILCSRNTAESLLVLSTHLTWMSARSRITLLRMSQYILATDVLTAPLFVSGDRNLTVAVLMCSSDMNDHALKSLPGCVHQSIQRGFCVLHTMAGTA